MHLFYEFRYFWSQIYSNMYIFLNLFYFCFACSSGFTVLEPLEVYIINECNLENKNEYSKSTHIYDYQKSLSSQHSMTSLL